MPWSAYVNEKIINLIFNKDAFTAPSAVYVAMHTGDPGTTGANEKTDDGATRILVYDNGSGSPDWNAAAVDGSGYIVDSDEEIVFPDATGTYADDISHVGFWDASSSGNFLGGGALAASVAVTSGNAFRFTANSLSFKST